MVFYDTPTYYYDTTTRYYDVTTTSTATSTTDTTALYTRRYDPNGNLYYLREPVRYTNFTPISDYNASPVPPKNWRWYDGFRIFDTPIYGALKEYAPVRLMKHQTRISMQQRYSHKRRNYLQKLYS